MDIFWLQYKLKRGNQFVKRQTPRQLVSSSWNTGWPASVFRQNSLPIKALTLSRNSLWLFAVHSGIILQPPPGNSYIKTASRIISILQLCFQRAKTSIIWSFNYFWYTRKDRIKSVLKKCSNRLLLLSYLCPYL